MRELIDEHYPEAEKLVQVMDNLKTHSPSSFYEGFPPQEARRLTEKLEIHYTPKHGSWLNMAEIELAVLARQCLTGAFPALSKHNSGLVPGNSSAITRTPPLIGVLPPLMRVSSSSTCIHLSNEGGQATSGSTGNGVALYQGGP